MKYRYAYDENRLILSVEECEKNKTYFADYDLSVKLVKAEGDQRQYLRLANNNVFADMFGGGESEEHFNAKMKIVKEGGYFDTVFNEFVTFGKMIPEFKQGNKKPDISCFDENDNLVMCIEIFYTHKKSIQDIEELKKLNIPIIEIDIKNGNECKHIIFTALLEQVKREIRTNENNIREANESFRQSSEGIRVVKKRFNEAIQRISRERGADFERIQSEYSCLKKEVDRERATRVVKIANWLQARKEIVRRKIFTIESNTLSVDEQDERYKGIKTEINRKRNAIIDNIKTIRARRRKVLLYDKYHRLGNSIVEQIENLKKKIK